MSFRQELNQKGLLRSNHLQERKEYMGVGAFFEMAYANEKGDRRRNSNWAISNEFYKGLSATSGE
jgi:hypothetical protein